MTVEEMKTEGSEMQGDEATISEDLAALEQAREALDEIIEANEEVKQAFAEMEEAKKRANNRKKEWEESVDRLTKLIAKQSVSLPLFDQPKPKTEAAEGEDWRKVSVEELETKHHVRHRYVKALIEGGIATMGDLADAKQAAGDKLFLWPSGIGKEGATEIDDAEVAFHEARQVASEEAEAAGEAEEPPVADDEVKCNGCGKVIKAETPEYIEEWHLDAEGLDFCGECWETKEPAQESEQ